MPKTFIIKAGICFSPICMYSMKLWLYLTINIEVVNWRYILILTSLNNFRNIVAKCKQLYHPTTLNLLPTILSPLVENVHLKWKSSSILLSPLAAFPWDLQIILKMTQPKVLFLKMNWRIIKAKSDITNHFSRRGFTLKMKKNLKPCNVWLS
jgi:hypothetical protein